MNVFLIISDTFRYDNLLEDTAMPVRTPHLDAFKKRAVSLSGLRTGSFPTIPHRTELISGRFNWPWYPWKDLTEQVCLPQVLASTGDYVTQLLCDCPHLFKASFQKRFHAAQALRGQESDLPFLRMNHEIKEVMPREKTRTGKHFMGRTLVDVHSWCNRDWQGERDTFPPRTAELACRWLEENGQHQHLFLWVDFFDPHEPWDPPEYMVSRYDPDYAGTPMLHPNYGKASDYSEEELRNLRAHYCAEAELVDRWVGRILQKIDDLQLWDDSLVLFTSDHGTSLGEHNRTGKTNINERDNRIWPMYPENACIPFLISGPGLMAGEEMDFLAQPADILPTILELLALDVDLPGGIHGKSFASHLRGKTTGEHRDLVVCSPHLRLDENGQPKGTDTPMVYTQEWGYVPIGVDQQPELYRIIDDRYAETNLIQDHGDVAKKLHEQFVAWLKELDAPETALAPFV